MSQRPAAGPKLFTVDEANAALPLVQAIVQDVVAVSQEIVERRERLSQIKGDRKPSAGDVYGDELAQIEEELEKERARLYEYAAELRELGVELKDGLTGLVDFPSRMEDRVVYLCWKLGESEVLHWHELDAGFSGRHPLTADAGTSPDASPSDDSSDRVE
jgi:hypothetical protein